MRLTTLCLLVFLVSAFAGCAGAGGESTSTTVPGGAPATGAAEIANPGEVREDAAQVAGLVIDEQQTPIAATLVGILELQLQATTDASGAFRFTNLAPGEYTLSAAALGFEAQTKRVTLAAGDQQSAVFTLVRLPSDVPYHDILPFDGFFSCKLGVPVQSTACGSVLVGPGVRTDDSVWANDKAFQWWNFTSPNFKTIIGELYWTQGTFATTTKLRSSFDHERFGSHWFCGQEGHGPIYYRYDMINETAANCQGNTVGGKNVAPLVPQFGKAMVTGFRVPFGCTPGGTSAACAGDPTDNPPMYLAFQQKVKSYMTIFYGEPAPEMWKAAPDQ